METSNQPNLPEENKDTLKDEHWEEGSDEEEEEKTKVPSQPKKVVQKDKHGEIIISKLDAYVEPTKTVKETRGDTKMTNKYNFGDLSFDEDEDEEEEEEEKTGAVAEETEEKKKKKSKPVKKTQKGDLDDLLKEFGIEAKDEEVKTKEAKPKKVKTEQPAESKEPKPEGEAESKKKKKKPATKTKTASSHVNELKREILERKEALKKREKKKGI